MTPSDFYALLHSIQSSEIEVYHHGKAEYANDPDNIFANFDRISTQLGLTREQVLLVYAQKHWDGIVSYVNGHRSQREDIRGRIKDLRMYLALLWGLVDDGSETEILLKPEKDSIIPGMVVETYDEFTDNSLWYAPLKSGQTVTFRIDDEEFRVVVNKVEISKDDDGNDMVTYILNKNDQIVESSEEHECDPSKGCGVEQKTEEIVNISKILSVDQDGLIAKLEVLVGTEDCSVCLDALTNGKLLRFQVDQSTGFYANIMGLNRLESEAFILDLVAKGRLDTLIFNSSKREGVYYRAFDDSGVEEGRKRTKEVKSIIPEEEDRLDEITSFICPQDGRFDSVEINWLDRTCKLRRNGKVIFQKRLRRKIENPLAVADTGQKD